VITAAVTADDLYRLANGMTPFVDEVEVDVNSDPEEPHVDPADVTLSNHVLDPSSGVLIQLPSFATFYNSAAQELAQDLEVGTAKDYGTEAVCGPRIACSPPRI
jgi:hypothetical protein